MLYLTVSLLLFQAHYRKALANRLCAQSSLSSGHKTADVKRKFERAMQSYATAYNFMTDPGQVKFRVRCICDLLRIGLERGINLNFPLRTAALHQCTSVYKPIV